MDQQSFKHKLDQIHAEIKAGKYENTGMTPEQVSGLLVVDSGLRKAQLPVNRETQGQYMKLFEPEFTTRYKMEQRGVRLPTYQELMDSFAQRQYQNYFINKWNEPERPDFLTPQQMIEYSTKKDRANWQEYLKLLDADKRASMVDSSLQNIDNEIKAAQQSVNTYQALYDELENEIKNYDTRRFAGITNKSRGIEQENTVDGKYYAQVVQGLEDAKAYLSSLEELRSSREIEAIKDSYSGLDYEDQMAAVNEALAEVRGQKSAGVIMGRAGAAARENYLQNEDALRRREDVLEDVRQDFQADRYLTEQDAARARLENQATRTYRTSYNDTLATIESEIKKAREEARENNEDYTYTYTVNGQEVIKLINLTPEELAVYETLRKYDTAAADEYKKNLERTVNARKAALREADIRDDGWFVNLLRYIGGFFASVGAGAANSLGVIRELVTDEYVPPDLNSDIYWGPQTRQTVREAFDEDIDSPMLSTIVQVGLSLTDTMMLAPFGVGAAMAGGFASARSDYTYDALQRGATFQEAWISGIAAGLAETIAEIIPLNRIFRMARTGGKWLSKEGLGNILKTAGMEASEETLSQYLGTVADIKIMGSRSQFVQTMQEYIAAGMSEGDAYRAAVEDYFVYQPLLAAFGGGIAGAAFGTGAQGVGNLRLWLRKRDLDRRRKLDEEAAAAIEKKRAREGNQDEQAPIAEDEQKPATEAQTGLETDRAADNDMAAVDDVMPLNNNAEADNANAEAGSSAAQPHTITDEQQAWADSIVEREMAEEEAEAAGLAEENFLGGELAERVTGVPQAKQETRQEPEREKNPYPAVDEGDVGFGEGALDEMPDSDPADRFRQDLTKEEARVRAQQRRKAKMMVRALRNKGIYNVRVEDLPEGINGYYDAQTRSIVVSSRLTNEEAFNFALGHEVVHHAATADADLVDDVISSMRADGIDVDARIAAVIARYRRHAAARGEDPSRIDERYAMEEVVADYIGEICRNDRYLQQLASDQPNLLVRIIRMLEDLLGNLGHSREDINKAREYEATISRVQDALAKAGHEEMIEGEHGWKFSLDPSFPYAVQEWLDSTTPADRIQTPGYFTVGSTSDALRSIGVKDYEIKFGKSKIGRILQKHQGMTADIIKQVPKIVENPIVVMRSKTQPNRITLFGEVSDLNGKPVLVAMELNPTTKSGEIMDFGVIASAYGKDNAQNLLNSSQILYVDQNENRTSPWLAALGLQLPSSQTKYGSANSIPQNETENNRRYSLEEENDPDLQRAIEMQQEGYSPTDISNATGKVVMANGDIYSGIGGVLQYSPNNTRGGDIGGRGEQEAGRERAYQGRADRENQTDQRLDEGQRVRRQSDGRGDRGGRGRVREEARGWEKLSEDERQGFAQIAKLHMQPEPGSELEIMLKYYNTDGDLASAYRLIAEEIYNNLAIHPALVEDRWVHFVPDVQALISDFETAMEDTGRRYSLEEDSEGDGLSGALTEEETTTANAMANGMPFEEALKATEDQTLTETPKDNRSFKEKASEKYRAIKRAFVDTLDEVARISKDAEDPFLYAYANNARIASQAAQYGIDGRNAAGRGFGAQVDVNGKKVGKSIAEIFAPIRAQGKDYTKAFFNYLLHQHNIDRMSLKERADATPALQEFQDFAKAAPEIAELSDFQRRQLAKEDSEAGRRVRTYIRLEARYDRIAATENKPVFAEGYDADFSRRVVEYHEKRHPEFKDYAKEVYKFLNNEIDYMVASGLISQEQAAAMREKYPHYVPTYREESRNKEKENIGSKDRNIKNTTAAVKDPIQAAEGGTAGIMAIDKAMGRKYLQTMRSGRVNLFGLRLYALANRKKDALVKYVHPEDKAVKTGEYDPDNEPEMINDLNNSFTIYANGRAVTMEINEGLFAAVKELLGQTNMRVPPKIIRDINSMFKALITSNNPFFLFRNFSRDNFDALFMTEDLREYAKNWPAAWKEIVSNGYYWQLYQSQGGFGNSFFDYNEGLKGRSERTWLNKFHDAILGRLEVANVLVEQAPRMAEFMAHIKQAEKVKGKGNASYEDIMEAMLAAADITTNFSRSGKIGKFINSSLVPFFNPGVQGASKMIRRFTETKGAKQWMRLIIRAAAVGIMPAALNAMLYDDDEEYADEWENINERDKMTNYLFRLGDGAWLKIPKGRVLSVISSLVINVADSIQGDDVDWGEFFSVAADQVAPASPITNNIFFPAFRISLFNNKDRGKTWYGSYLETQRDQSLPPSQRYDSNTDALSIFLGDVLNLSPKKIHDLLDSYTGVVGDIVLPLLTNKAERGGIAAPLVSSFSIDPTYSNNIGDRYYEIFDQYDQASNDRQSSADEQAKANLVVRFLNKQTEGISDLYKEIEEIEDSDISSKEKKEQTSVLRAEINLIRLGAIENAEEYAEVAARMYDKYQDEDTAYLYANKEVIGSDYAIKVYNKKVYEKALEANEHGVSFDEYFDSYFGTRGLDKKEKIDYWLEMPDMDDDDLYYLYVSDYSDDAKIDIAMDVDIPVSEYLSYVAMTQDVEADKDRNGKTISGSKKRKILAIIDSLDLTIYQKNILYELSGYSESTMFDSPWYD